MLINNTTKRVIVLKTASSRVSLFCKPGLNEFSVASIKPYTDGNKAASGHFDEGSLEIVKMSKQKEAKAASVAEKASEAAASEDKKEEPKGTK